MKNALLLVAAFLLIQVSAFARKTDESKMLGKAKELSYMGQIDKANELMGEEKLSSKSNGSSGSGWSTTSIALSLLWGSIGTGFFMYGKARSKFLFLLCGIGLCVFPMMVSDVTVSLILGAVMTAVPFKLGD